MTNDKQQHAIHDAARASAGDVRVSYLCQANDRQTQEFFAARKTQIKEAIREAARSAGRNPDDVELLAVSKTLVGNDFCSAIKAGYRQFGENRVHVLQERFAAIEACQASGLSFDLIGHLQTNKARHVVGKVRLIHSVDSVHLAQKLNELAAAANVNQAILLQVNLSHEESKSGFDEQELLASLEILVNLKNIEIAGLMTMAMQGNLTKAQRTFEACRNLRDVIQTEVGDAWNLATLSMGMSEDFIAAIQEGATIIRLGRTLFDRE